MNNKSIAYAWRTGQIEIGQELPNGALPIISGDEFQIRNAIAKTASVHQHIAMIPNITRTFGEDARVNALIQYKEKVDRFLKAEMACE